MYDLVEKLIRLEQGVGVLGNGSSAQHFQMQFEFKQTLSELNKIANEICTSPNDSPLDGSIEDLKTTMGNCLLYNGVRREAEAEWLFERIQNRANCHYGNIT